MNRQFARTILLLSVIVLVMIPIVGASANQIGVFSKIAQSISSSTAPMESEQQSGSPVKSDSNSMGIVEGMARASSTLVFPTSVPAEPETQQKDIFEEATPSRKDSEEITAGDEDESSAISIPRSELQVSWSSARITDFDQGTSSSPTNITIDTIAVSSEILPVGIKESSNEMELPDSAQSVAWYRYGASPGDEGSAVLAGHVDFNFQRGVFFELAKLETGARAIIEYADGSARTFEIFERDAFQADQLPSSQIFRRSGAPVLTLITCGGTFDPNTKRYEQTIVLYAREI